MKTIFTITFALLLTLAANATDQVVAKCGKYRIQYRGQTESFFSGIKVSTPDFLIDTGSLKLSGSLKTDSEGGTLTAEYRDNKTQNIHTFVYNDHWTEKTFSETVNGQVVETLDCLKP